MVAVARWRRDMGPRRRELSSRTGPSRSARGPQGLPGKLDRGSRAVMAPYQNQIVAATALRRGPAIDFPRVLSGLFGQGFVTPDWRGLFVRACLAAGCARRASISPQMRQRKPGAAERNEPRLVPKATPVTTSPIRRSGSRLRTHRSRSSYARAQRLTGVGLGGREPMPLAFAFRLGPAKAHVSSGSFPQIKEQTFRSQEIRPPSSKKHARTNFERRAL